MTLWHRFRTMWRNLRRTQQVDRDLENELRSYQELLEDEKVRSGLPAAQALREARLELGSTSLIQEQVRDVRLGVTLGNLMAEIRQSFRSLRRNPGLTIMATLMLAVGMGASTVVFSIFHAALIRPLPFRDPGRLVEVFETHLDRGIDHASFAEANFWDLRSLNRSFEEMAAYHVVLETSKGDITLAFRPDKAPEHVRNFLRLAQSGAYDGTTFHRVVRGFVIQGGMMSPRATRLTQKQQSYVHNLQPEFNDILHVAGTLSMARLDDPASASTSFFICTAPAPSLDGKYTAFGQVIAGMEVVQAIEAVAVQDDTPTQKIEVRRVRVEKQ